MPKRPLNLPEPEVIAGRVQPEAAMAFWAWKSALPYETVKKLEGVARERAFYVTALAERDAVQAVKDSLGAALAEGESFRDWQARIADLIAQQGWRGDRIETIFRNNLQTAYAAGRYAKMQEVKESRPYWQYMTVGDERVRPSHSVLHLRVYPADHEFWNENYAPNGHKCRCAVRTLSERQVASEGLTVESEMPGDCMYTDPATGMEYHVARPGADNGWRSNPGKAWLEDGATLGLPLERHPDLTPESYAEERLRPAPVKDYVELAKGIQEKAKPFLRNSAGVTGVALNQKKYFMATDSRGYFYISKKPYADAKMGKFVPHMCLKDAWNKLAAGKPMEWAEEYAVEMLWHEIVHNRQRLGPVGGAGSLTRRVMEIVTQWTARRTYPDFLQSLGAAPSHLESIKADGLGYGHYVKCFDRLLSVLGINENGLLTEMRRVIDTVPRGEYLDPLVDYLHAQTKPRQKRSIIREAIMRTKEYNYEAVLRRLELIG